MIKQRLPGDPWPTLINYDQGSEFIGHEFKTMMEEDYGSKN